MPRTLIPPDGGYGWVIVFASVLNNFLMVPLIQNVVLIFKDKMLEIDMTVTQMWFALNVHTSFIYITHLLNNLLLTRFGYRKVTLAGVSFVFCGLSMSSWIHNYLGFMLTFGFVTGIGVGLNASSCSLAIKSYFTTNQNKAIGLSMTLTALGPILMPQIISALNQNYHPDGVILILAAAQRRGSTLPSQPKVLTKTTWWKSEESINLESCYDIFEENESLETIELNEHTNNSDKMNSKSNGNCKSLGKDFQFEEHKIYKDPNFDINSLPWYKRHLYRVVGLLGLDIFLNLRYVNILIGLSLVVLVEMNFVVLLPFLLFEYSFTISEIAAFLSVLGAADIVFRFLPPHVGDCLKKPARVMIILVLGVIIAARLALIYISHYPTILIIALILGCSKGMRVVYMSLIIPSYVPEQHLASALVIQIVLNSLMSLLGGYAIGITRTTTGSYVYCVILLEFLTALTIVMWSADILIKKCSRKKSKPSNVSTARAEEVY
uniref:Major facilitator superfamily (MFS) profile domain-containing protein n=1 Tax=Dendroctonus ponderosae TaxID=77166 RepID=A0AAR5P5W0_DENPD